ncbi:probable catalase-3 [Cephalotrichum gorgonifer]|uniref:Catalase n=1 Tax=Cephalotrichum gorgonifer TaxID=2041049 RepID=A0AAE8SSD9_9PEZI|nr:probable catalase-3 [Cephalotrichum gorgonifer]
MRVNVSLAQLLALQAATVAAAGQCPFAQRAGIAARNEEAGDAPDSRQFIQENDIADGPDDYMTSDVGGRFTEQRSLKAGRRGPTLLEDFAFRQKMQHFDHERVPERVVHARGAGAYGSFTSYGDYSNITAASFLGQEGKVTPVFVRFSTVLGSRGSADTARDVHGFATRFYTDEGNFDIVGNNIPVFFIQDAAQFPDLIHAGKPSPNNEIPQAATAHDSAWDFFTQQSTSLHTLFFAMSGYGIPRSFRHVDGFGVNTYRFVNDAGESKLIKWHWRSMQGKASLVWEEAQVAAGANPDFHRADLYEAIEAGNYPEWELSVQLINEDDAQAFGFDVLDATKIVPEEVAPLHKLGKLRLDTNPKNFFAETEQIMFQPAHVVRGIDFSEDPLLQGRLFSYLDTQLSRNGGPNFEQIPINRPVTPIHNNNRDGAGQMYIHENIAHYQPNTLGGNTPQQANQTNGRGFFTAPGRRVDGPLTREDSESFADHWSQPRLFYNSLTPAEQQQVIDAMRFEASQVKSDVVKENILVQLNKVSHDIATRVATALGMDAPAPDPTYYHNKTTKGFSIMAEKLRSVAGLRVGVLATVEDENSLSQAAELKSQFAQDKVDVLVVAESLRDGVDMTYSATRAHAFDAVVVTAGTENIFDPSVKSTLYPPGRPAQTLEDAYRWGKPIGAVGSASKVYNATDVQDGPGVYAANSTSEVVGEVKDGLAQFKFVDRFPMDK